MKRIVLASPLSCLLPAQGEGCRRNCRQRLHHRVHWREGVRKPAWRPISKRADQASACVPATGIKAALLGWVGQHRHVFPATHRRAGKRNWPPRRHQPTPAVAVDARNLVKSKPRYHELQPRPAQTFHRQDSPIERNWRRRRQHRGRNPRHPSGTYETWEEMVSEVKAKVIV